MPRSPEHPTSTSRRHISPQPPRPVSPVCRSPAEYGGGGLTLAHEKIWREVKGNYPMMDGESHHQPRHVPADAQRVRHAGAEAAVPRRQHLGPHDVVPDVLRTGRRLRCRQPADRRPSSTVTSGCSNGQKVWTTLAHESDYGIVIARTDPDQVKHAGMSMFIIDMKAPGVEIRPIHQIDGGSPLQRGVLHRRADPRRLADRRAEHGWKSGDGNAHVRARRDRLVPAPARSTNRSSSSCSKAAKEYGSDRRPGRARPADADLVDGDHQVPGCDAEP